MTFILIASFFLIAFVGLLRYDVHKHKYANLEKNKRDAASGSGSSTESSDTSKNHHDNHSNDSSDGGGDGGD